MNELSEAPRMTERLNVLLVIESSGGGSGRHVLDLAESLAERGHAITLAFSPLRLERSFAERLRMLGQYGKIEICEVPMERSVGASDVRAFALLWKLVRQAGPFDILHAHSSKAGALLRMLPATPAARVYTPHALRIMDPDIGRASRVLYSSIERFLGRFRSEAIIAVSPVEADVCREIGIPAELVATVINGVDAPASLPARAPDCVEEYPGDVVFGFVGRLCHQKAPMRLIEAFEELDQSRVSSRLVIVGGGEDHEALERRIASGAVQDRITLVGECDAADWFPIFDVFVLPSRYEAMPYVLLEAAACGLPIVSTEVGGAEVVIDHECNGLIVDQAASVTGLREALARCLDPAFLGRLRNGAAQRRERFTRAHMVDSTERVYIEALRRRRGEP